MTLELSKLSFAHPNANMNFSYSMQAKANSITLVSGASGSGKSTLFDLIAGYLTPHSGEMDLDGLSLLPLHPSQRPVTALFQANNLFDHLSAIENVQLGQKGDRAQITQHALQALNSVGLSAQANQSAHSLSGGQQQRVALARALLRDKPILLLDEPFSGLDDDLADQMRTLVKDLTVQKKWTTLLISHAASDRDPKFIDAHYVLSDGALSLA